MKTRFTYDSYGYLTGKTLLNQILELEFDTLSGNLMSRGISTGFHLNRESFTYDALNRLDSSFINMNNHQKFTYDGSGNILTKTGIGNYVYISPHFNRLDSIADPGPLMPTSKQDYIYNSNNLTTTILDSLSLYKLELKYGPGNQRIRTILTQEGDTVKTKYFTTAFEKEITASGERDLHYIYSPYGLIAVIIKQGTNENLYYTFTDQLESIISLLNPDGSLAERYSYDAWGRRRNPLTWTYDSIPAPTLIDRGYTGHEHLDEFGLINMNGRMYDPALGRFLSVDPYIQFPESAQSYNGYGYCLNNPLLYSDPSGYLLTAREAYAEAVKSDYDLSYADFLGDYMSQYFDLYYNYLTSGGGRKPYTMTFRWKSPGKNVLWDIKKAQKENPDGIMLGEVIKDGGYAGIHSITINVGSWGLENSGADFLKFDADYVNRNRTEGYLIWFHSNGKEIARYKATSGSGSPLYYTIPPHTYTATNYQRSTDVKFMRNGVGFKISIGPSRVWDWDKLAFRTDLLIHPARYNGTEGCIGLIGDYFQILDFQTRISDYLNDYGKIKVIVEY